MFTITPIQINCIELFMYGYRKSKQFLLFELGKFYLLKYSFFYLTKQNENGTELINMLTDTINECLVIIFC